MGIELDARDVLTIATELEHRGLRFYQLAAAQAGDAISKGLFEELASMEDQHEQVFQGLGAKLGVEQGAAVDDNSPQWNLVAKTFLGGLEGDLVGRFSRKVGQVEILREAMAFEKDTIALLLALKAMLPLENDQASVDRLIREELGHLLLLGSRMAQADCTPWRKTHFFGESSAPSA